MYCYYKYGGEVLAICRTCDRGLWHGCISEFHGAMACKGRCAEEYEAPQNGIENDRTSIPFSLNDSRHVLRMVLIGWASAMVIAGFALVIMGGLRGAGFFLVLGGFIFFLSDLYHRDELVPSGCLRPGLGQEASSTYVIGCFSLDPNSESVDGVPCFRRSLSRFTRDRLPRP